MTRRFTWIAVGFVSMLSSACLGGNNSINAHGGVRQFESNDYEEVEEPVVYGLDAVVDTSVPWLAVEGGWFHAEDDASSSSGSSGAPLADVDLGFEDYFLGLRVTPWHFLIEPYGGIGVNYVDADLDALDGTGTSVGGSDSDFGYYVRLGAAVRLGFIRFGLEGRSALGADVDLGAIDTDADNLQVTAFVGVAF
jgi:hypothetical protein